MSTSVRAGVLLGAFFVLSGGCSADRDVDDDDDSIPGAVTSGYQAACKPQSGPTYALHGIALLPSGPTNAWIVVSNEKIAQIETDAQHVPQGAPIIETNGIIAPGLIDIHNHVAYDFLPFWNSGKRWQNRYQWARASAYSAAVKTPYNAVKNGGHACEAIKYGEWRAIVGGTTSIQGSADLTCTRSWARNIEFGNFCQDPIRQNVLSVADLTQADANGLNAQFASGKTKAYFIHLAEGVDDSSRAEFDHLEQIGLLQPQVIGIHSTALDAPRLQKMGKAGMKIVWSPLSNLALYGKTTDIPTALAAGINVSIAPDWSPSGSANVLGELKVADRLNRERFSSLISDRQLVEMVTSNPAKAIAMDDKLGSIAVGLYADLVVLRGDTTKPYRAVIDAQPADVLLTTVGGQAFYGTSAIIQAIGDKRSYSVVDACGESRMLGDTETTLPIPSGAETLQDVQQTFASAGVTNVIPLFQCTSAPEWAFQ